jgi:hypothetical protein
VNYFENLKVDCHLLKIRCSKSNFVKSRGINVIYPYSFLSKISQLILNHHDTVHKTREQYYALLIYHSH